MTRQIEEIAGVVSCDSNKLNYLVNSCKISGIVTEMDVRGIVSLGVPLYHHLKKEPLLNDSKSYRYASLRRALIKIHNKFNQ